MLTIDAHHHFWQYNFQKHAWIDDSMQKLRRDYMPKDLKKELDQLGIEGCVSVQADQSEEETDFLLQHAQQNSFIKGVVGWVDLRAENVEDRLEHYSQFNHLKGLRHVVQDEPNDEFLLRQDFQRGIEKLNKHDLCYDILIFARHLPVAVRFAEKFADQKFVLDHIGKPDISEQKINTWEEGIRALAQHPFMYCKLSGIVTEAEWDSWSKEDIRPYLEVVMDAFGPDRLMFGSDWPVCTLAGSYTDVYNLIYDYIQPLSRQEKNAVMGANAQEFYELK